MNIEVIWNTIKQYEGEVFYTIKRKAYSYVVQGDCLIIKNIKGGKIKKESIGKAITIANPTPKKIELAGCWGPSYIYGIITDKRVRGV